jgi:hypothetical protein
MIFTDCRKVNEYVTNIDPMIFEQLRQFGHSQVRAISFKMYN